MTTLVRKHQMPWFPHADRDERLRSAINIAALVLANQSILVPAHQRELLSLAVWKATECDGKWSTRFRSKGVMTGPLGVKMNHEHVVTRKWMISSMISNPDRVTKLLSLAVGCMVTTDEHRHLTEGWGWERYLNAGVVVMDAQTGTRLDLKRAQNQLFKAMSELKLSAEL